MKNNPFKGWSKPAATLFLITLLSTAGAQTWIRYDAQPGSKIRIAGTSTIHDWTMEGALIKGFMELDSNFKLDPSIKPVTVNPRVEVEVPVRSIKSDAKRMDEVAQEAMNIKDHPLIQYRLLELTPTGAARDVPNGVGFNAKGALTISGVTKTNLMPIVMQQVNPTQMKVTGKAPIKMTDYGVKPPAPQLALGLIKVGDDVTVSFEWITAVPDGGKPPGK